MKTSKSEVTYLILSIILVALAAGIYFIFGNSTTDSTSSSQTTALSTNSEDDTVATAEALLSALEASPSTDALASVQEAIDQVNDEMTRAELQARLDAVSAELTNEEAAEAAVTAAETYQTSVYIEEAQAAVDVLTNETVKSGLQERIDAVSAAMAGFSSPAYTEDSTQNYSSDY